MKGRKTGGRVKGSRNRTTAEVQRALLQVLDDNLDGLSADLKALTPFQRATVVMNLIKHLTPPAVNPERLTEEQLEQVAGYLNTRREEQDSGISDMTDEEIREEIRKLTSNMK